MYADHAKLSAKREIDLRRHPPTLFGHYWVQLLQYIHLSHSATVVPVK